LEGFNLGGSFKWSAEVQADISFLLNLFTFAVVLRFAETLHESFETSPFPVCPGEG